MQDMSQAFRIFIFHTRRYNFAYIWNFAHGYNFGDVQVGRVRVFLYGWLLACDISRDLVGHCCNAKTAEGQN
ncbi:hypothetical protein BK635_19470 [Pseudomonas chlororaphis]|nr:hypothetical protein BK636_20425 [Pseudomonas chlororaphis]ROL91434.1 hypothetical protein BK637_05500 [Pseudomonas chlororaphis]RON78517.1 hypothetical protein BK635_19470 [Pseudomonas chlororaphis]